VREGIEQFGVDHLYMGIDGNGYADELEAATVRLVELGLFPDNVTRPAWP